MFPGDAGVAGPGATLREPLRYSDARCCNKQTPKRPWLVAVKVHIPPGNCPIQVFLVGEAGGGWGVASPLSHTLEVLCRHHFLSDTLGKDLWSPPPYAKGPGKYSPWTGSCFSLTIHSFPGCARTERANGPCCTLASSLPSPALAWPLASG